MTVDIWTTCVRFSHDGIYDVVGLWGNGRADEPHRLMWRVALERTRICYWWTWRALLVFLFSLSHIASSPPPPHQAFCCSDAALNAALPCSPQLLFSGKPPLWCKHRLDPPPSLEAFRSFSTWVRGRVGYTFEPVPEIRYWYPTVPFCGTLLSV